MNSKGSTQIMKQNISIWLNYGVFYAKIKIPATASTAIKSVS